MSLNCKRIVVFSIFLWIMITAGLLIWSKKQIHFDTDLAEMNRIYKEVELHWDTIDQLNSQSFTYDYVVYDDNWQIRYKTAKLSEGLRSVEDAIREHNAYYYVWKDNRVIGTILIDSRLKEELLSERLEIGIGVLIFSTLILLLSDGLIYYLEKEMIRPFRRMEHVAHNIARGELDIPLPMDRHHLFGAFTESLDLLREELKKAREQEYEANRSKKELVASLSHDIKTPVTSIKLVSEVLLAKQTDENLIHKITSIYRKAEQIDALVTNMFQATLEDLGELTVECVFEDSKVLSDIVEMSDYKDKVQVMTGIPSCLIYVDRLRIEQVISNILNNSYKYADTRIEVTYELEEDVIKILFKDYGDGVPEEELSLIFQKYYRGKAETVRTQSGSGLGLYLSNHLMQRMGGAIMCYNAEDGFVAEVVISLKEKTNHNPII